MMVLPGSSPYVHTKATEVFLDIKCVFEAYLKYKPFALKIAYQIETSKI